MSPQEKGQIKIDKHKNWIDLKPKILFQPLSFLV